jgi:hypothetical protein
MVQDADMMRIEGTVNPCFLDSICLSHRICIVAKDGHVYEIEPNYVGLYLERFIGHRVVVQGQPVTNGRSRSVVRLSSLQVLKDPPENGAAATVGRGIPADLRCHEEVLDKVEMGGSDA